MSWRREKTDEGYDLVYDGVESGIAPSPTKGTANLQNVNIDTESGEAMASFARTAQQQVAITGGTLTPDGATLFDAPATLKAGTWIQVTASTVTSITPASGATTANISYLAVAGGGGGSFATGTAAGGGGGGAGAFIEDTDPFAVGSYDITVGLGGSGGTFGGSAADGGDSIIETIVTAEGGGAGGAGFTAGQNGSNGGSGGGGGAVSGTTAGTAGTGTTGGNNGGTGYQDGTDGAGGGGGGAGGAGSNATNTGTGTGGNGGLGDNSTISGATTFYAGGGGGGGATTGGTASSTYGGGSGGSGNAAGGDATANTGSGGGGAGATGGSVASGGDGGSGIVILSYPTNTLYATGGEVTYSGTNTIHTFRESGVFTIHSINTGGYYFVSYKNGSNKIKLSAQYDPYGENPLTHGTTGSITFNVVATVGRAIAKATERFGTATSYAYRYYALDANGRVWVYDTDVYASTLAASGVGTQWMLPDYQDYSTQNYSGMAVIAGWLIVPNLAYLQAKPTTDLGRYFGAMPGAALNNPLPTHKNFAMTGSQGKMYYCDSTYIGEVFPTTSFVTAIANIQSNSQFTADGKLGTITKIISDSIPWSPEGTRIPVVFYTDRYGTLPTAITEGTLYYLSYNTVNKTFSAYTSPTIATAIDMDTGASGNQFFNTFYPMGAETGPNGDTPLVQITSQRVNLPNNETAQCLVEIGNIVLIGCSGSTVYPWNQVDATPSDVIALPEANVQTMVNVNNMGYIFAGNKGNIYITNGAVASHVMKVPDYCAGVPGTPLTYIEPYFTWGGSEYLRGRVFFSILDQTATKAGNCGGIWSFVPSENIAPSDDAGMSLRLENQNSYGDYDGVAHILIANQEQNAIAPQFWSFWQDAYTGGNYGIDYTGTVPTTTFVIETDLMPTGTFLSKDTFNQLEYKLTTPLASGDSVQLYWRLNSTNAWTSAGTVKEETTNRISGYYGINFQKTQWVQIRLVGTTNGTTTSSFNRFKEIRLR